MPPEPLASDPAILEAFLIRWHDAEDLERANYQLFVGALCALLDLPAPEPATGQRERDSYVFERRDSLRQAPEQFAPMVGELWRAMDGGQFSVAIRAALPHFNGKLFKQPEALPLERAQIELLREAARADWREVEPANFGTLLERALSPTERSRLGAHYTPRASWSGWCCRR